jgi:hypothetical protein
MKWVMHVARVTNSKETYRHFGKHVLKTFFERTCCRWEATVKCILKNKIYRSVRIIVSLNGENIGAVVSPLMNI